ncbi:hypothetical protein GALMADRAFT_243774 [Galerina marginata CBS 339.88]|uniref:MYND-type domain-containing protein n=1 Tax=Galerina marginata (strain CBS 339.88) TaxID=685588 RepID=A0A067TIE5_GALM3|nr:hypothetical protein GALMADRAFT_243774 [Galerina marginata CBS 339.88]
MPLNRDPHLSDDQRAAYTRVLNQMPPARGHKCSVCERIPEANEFPTCAKCKSTVYCSRECQKKDWPDHKRHCSEPDKHRNFMLKWFGRFGSDTEFKIYLQMSLTEGFFDTFTQAPDANRKMWIFAVNFFLCPIKEEHLAALASTDISLGTLFDVPMVGKIMASKFVDISDQEKYPLEPRLRDMWQTFRDSLDNSCDVPNSIAVMVIFKYLGSKTYVSVDSILPQEIAEVKKKREQARNAHREFPGPIRHLDRWLQELRNSKGEKVVCEMGDGDKTFFRIGDLAAATLPDREYVLSRLGP